MKGIVDELRLDDLGKMVIVELKTRRSNSFPSDAQKRTAELQVGNAQHHCYVVKLGCLACYGQHTDAARPQFSGKNRIPMAQC